MRKTRPAAAEERVVKVLEDFPGKYTENEVAIKAFAATLNIHKVAEKHSLVSAIKVLPTIDEYIRSCVSEGNINIDIMDISKATDLAVRTVYNGLLKSDLKKFIHISPDMCKYLSGLTTVGYYINDIRFRTSKDILEYELEAVLQDTKKTKTLSYLKKLYKVYDIVMKKYDDTPFRVTDGNMSRFLCMNGYVNDYIWITELISDTILKNPGKYSVDDVLELFKHHIAPLRTAFKRNDIITCISDYVKPRTQTDEAIEFLRDNHGKYTITEVANKLKVDTSLLSSLRSKGKIHENAFVYSMPDTIENKILKLVMRTDKIYTRKDMHSRFGIRRDDLIAIIRRNPVLKDRIDLSTKRRMTPEVNSLYTLVSEREHYISLIKERVTMDEMRMILKCKSPVARGFISAMGLWEFISDEVELENMYTKFLNNGDLEGVREYHPSKVLTYCKRKKITDGAMYAYCINMGYKDYVIAMDAKLNNTMDIKPMVIEFVESNEHKYTKQEIAIEFSICKSEVHNILQENNLLDYVLEASKCVVSVRERYNSCGTLELSAYSDLDYSDIIIMQYIRGLKTRGEQPKKPVVLKKAKENKIKLKRGPKVKAHNVTFTNIQLVDYICEHPTMFTYKELAKISNLRIKYIKSITQILRIDHLVKVKESKEILNINDLKPMLMVVGELSYEEATNVLASFGVTTRKSDRKSVV